MRFKKYLNEGKKVTLKQINKVANKYGIQLVKDKGYFYWTISDKNPNQDIFLLPETGVYVYKINDLSYDRWMSELQNILNQLQDI